MRRTRKTYREKETWESGTTGRGRNTLETDKGKTKRNAEKKLTGKGKVCLFSKGLHHELEPLPAARLRVVTEMMLAHCGVEPLRVLEAPLDSQGCNALDVEDALVFLRPLDWQRTGQTIPATMLRHYLGTCPVVHFHWRRRL